MYYKSNMQFIYALWRTQSDKRYSRIVGAFAFTSFVHMSDFSSIVHYTVTWITIISNVHACRFCCSRRL